MAKAKSNERFLEVSAIMDSSKQIPDEIKRFILRSIDSVPHLEAIMVFCRQPHINWDAKAISHILYISEKKSADILSDLSESGFISCQRTEDALVYRYSPKSLGLEKLIMDLERVYSAHLIEVINLIHSKTNKQAQSFGDAFKWRPETE